ncbi:MAG: hypothetical protein LBR54_01685 [Oscillospiraceae bacterium]|jgi:hypothetical protein|nr:hypothetical protein [Oscillospiraceae bacterium]
MKIFKKHPALEKQFEKMYQTRRDEILNEMLSNDEEYKRLNNKRTDASMDLKRRIAGTETDILFEKYSDAAFAHDAYELDALYKKGVEDALNVLEENDLIK